MLVMSQADSVSYFSGFQDVLYAERSYLVTEFVRRHPYSVILIE